MESRRLGLLRAEDSSRKRILTLEQEDRAQAVSVSRYVIFRQRKEEEEVGPGSTKSTVQPRGRSLARATEDLLLQKVVESEDLGRLHIVKLQEQTWTQLTTAWTSTKRMLLAQLKRVRESTRREKERERERETLKERTRERERVMEERKVSVDVSGTTEGHAESSRQDRRDSWDSLERQKQGLVDAEDMRRMTISGQCDRSLEEITVLWRTMCAKVIEWEVRRKDKERELQIEQESRQRERKRQADWKQQEKVAKDRELAAVGRAFESRKQGLLEAEDMSRLRTVSLEQHAFANLVGLFRTGASIANLRAKPQPPPDSSTGSNERRQQQEAAEAQEAKEKARVLETKRQMLFESEDMSRLRFTNTETQEWADLMHQHRLRTPVSKTRGSRGGASRSRSGSASRSRSGSATRPNSSTTGGQRPNSSSASSNAAKRSFEPKRQVLLESEDMARLRISSTQQQDYASLLQLFQSDLAKLEAGAEREKADRQRSEREMALESRRQGVFWCSENLQFACRCGVQFQSFQFCWFFSLLKCQEAAF